MRKVLTLVLLLVGCATGNGNRASIGYNEDSVYLPATATPTPEQAIGDHVEASTTKAIRVEARNEYREPDAGARLRVEDVDQVITEIETDESGVANISLRYTDAASYVMWEKLFCFPACSDGRLVPCRWAPIMGGGAFRRTDARTGYRVVVLTAPKAVRGVAPLVSPCGPPSPPVDAGVQVGHAEGSGTLLERFQAAFRAGDIELTRQLLGELLAERAKEGTP